MILSTFLLIYLHLQIEVDAQYQQIRCDIQASHAHQYLRIIKWYLFRDLHHPEYDYQVGARGNQKLAIRQGSRTRLQRWGLEDQTYICGLTITAMGKIKEQTWYVKGRGGGAFDNGMKLPVSKQEKEGATGRLRAQSNIKYLMIFGGQNAPRHRI